MHDRAGPGNNERDGHNMKQVEIFTDGACSGNPGPGGWGAVLRFGSVEKELCGGEETTTNNRMELSAAISALTALKEPCQVPRRHVPLGKRPRRAPGK